MKKINLHTISSHQKGLTYIELIIILLVITVLVTLAYIAYTSFLKKARRVEAMSVLDHIAELEAEYYAANNKYTDDQDALVFALKGSVKYYSITITVPAGPNPQSFEARVSGNIDRDLDLDVWTIDQDRNLVHTTID